MGTKRFRLNDKHEHMEKFNKLIDYANELGIEMVFGSNRSLITIDNKEYEILDVDQPYDHPVEDFPPAFEVKLVYEVVEPEPFSEQDT